MNLDDPDEERELNLNVDNYIVAEYVAIPNNFELTSYLSMREQVGLFDIKGLQLPTLKLLCYSIQNSPVFSSMNNPNLNPRYCFFLLQLFSELDLVVKTIDNPFRRGMNDKLMLHYAKTWEQERYNTVRGQDVKRISFIFFNLFYLFNEEIYSEIYEKVEQVNKYQKKLLEEITKLKKGMS